MRLPHNQTQPLDALVLDEMEPAPPPVSKEHLDWLHTHTRTRSSLSPRDTGAWTKDNNPYQSPAVAQTWIQAPPTGQPYFSRNQKILIAVSIAVTILANAAAALFGFLDARYSITGMFD